jgi:uncharacterized protein (TIGR03067 family)
MVRWLSAMVVLGFVIPQARAGGEDVKRLQGTWVVVSGEKGGKKGAGADFETFAAKFRLTITGTKFRSSGPGSDDAGGTFQVDSAKKPKEITFTRDDGKQTKGVYEFRDGLLRLCSGRPGDPRPKGFQTEEGSPAILLVLKQKTK